MEPEQGEVWEMKGVPRRFSFPEQTSAELGKEDICLYYIFLIICILFTQLIHKKEAFMKTGSKTLNGWSMFLKKKKKKTLSAALLVWYLAKVSDRMH